MNGGAILNFRTIRESADGMSRVVQRSDGTYWAQRIWTDAAGAKRWEVVELTPEQAEPMQYIPYVPLWRRMLRSIRP